MAKMIPERPSEDTKSSAETNLFRRFRDMPDTDDWTILHSVAIAHHTTQSQGEIDFVAVIPGAGVLSLEVKGGRISPCDGTWYSVDRDDVSHRIKNPVEEANNASHSLCDYVYESDPTRTLGRPMFGFGVVFPNTTYHGKVNTVELADEQVADCDDCLSPADIKAYLLRLADYWRRRRAPGITLPNAAQCRQIVKLLRPDFSGKVSMRSLIRTVENQSVELTENQQDIFETIMDNPRCIVRGGAGTGKTIIALHFARQMAGKNCRTGFFCYNRQLSEYLNEHIEHSDNFVCGSYTEYMESIVKQAGKKPELSGDGAERDRYYLEELPQLFADAYIELDLPPFDYLILDEAQDLMTERYLESLDLILLNGISGGNWYFFMDAENQNVFHNDKKGTDVIAMVDEYKTYYTRCMLRDNCRNSVKIIEKVDSIFGTTTRHRSNNEHGMDVVTRTYRRSSEQSAVLSSILELLEKEDIPKRDIVVLSPVRFENSAASRVTEHRITTDRKSGEDAVFFSTVHRFKGLESPVVILTDLDYLDDLRRSLLYVGMTRAKSALFLLVNEKISNL